AFDGLMPKSLRDALQPRVPTPEKPTSPDEGQREKGARGLFEFLVRGAFQALGLLPVDDDRDRRMRAVLAEVRRRYRSQDTVDFTVVAKAVWAAASGEDLARLHGWLLGAGMLGRLLNKKQAPMGRFEFVTKVLDQLTAKARQRTGKE